MFSAYTNVIMKNGTGPVNTLYLLHSHFKGWQVGRLLAASIMKNGTLPTVIIGFFNQQR